MGFGAGSGGAFNFVYAVLWFLVLVLVAFWVSSICAILYIILSCFTPCIPSLQSACDALMKGVNLCHLCVTNMIAGKSF